MSHIERKFVPLPDVESEKVRFAVKLPDYIDPHKIGVNVSGIERLCRIGGIKHLRVEGSYDKQQHANGASVMGVTGSGAAYMGGIASAESSLYEESGEESDPMYAPWFGRWINGKITVDMQGVANKLGENNRWTGGVRSVNGWTHHLNKAVKRGIVNIGTEHLVYGMTKSELAICAFVNAYAFLNAAAASPSAVLSGDYNPHVPSVNEVAQSLIFMSLFMTLVAKYYVFREELKDKDMHWSLIFGPQIDRALLLQGAARTTRLVKHLDT